MSMERSAHVIQMDGAPPPGGHYSQAIKHNGLVYVSGQLPIKPDGGHMVDESFDRQARQCLSNLIEIVRASGSAPSDVLRVSAYIVGTEYWPQFNSIYAEIFGDHRPARTVVPVPGLHYGYLVEVDAIVAAPDDT